MKENMLNKIFVYGTLKVGGHFAKKFDSKRTKVVPANINGKMFCATGWYPAVVPYKDSIVHGELHTYSDIENVVKELDMIEGYIGENNESNLYNRNEVIVTKENGTKERAIVYFFNHSTSNLKEIENGEWQI